MSVRWQTIRGKQVLFVDYSGCTSEEDMLATYEEQARIQHGHGQKALVLSDMTGTSIGTAYMKRVTEGGKAHGEQLLEKAAFVGITGLKNILLDSYITLSGQKGKVASFATREEALDWLVE